MAWSAHEKKRLAWLLWSVPLLSLVCAAPLLPRVLATHLLLTATAIPTPFEALPTIPTATGTPAPCFLALLFKIPTPTATPSPTASATPTPTWTPTPTATPVCRPIPDVTYDTLSVNGPPTDRPAEEHADLNLALRGYVPIEAPLGLIDYSGGGDGNAPQLVGLTADWRYPVIAHVYRVYDWDWARNARGAPLATWEVTLIGLEMQLGETIHVPDSGYSIGSGYEVLVLYAHPERITLKYTREDNVVRGYTLHLEGVCVEPDLLTLYQAANAAGRGRLPALRAGQALGRAWSNELGVAIRDNGNFMDPRSRKDWWRGLGMASTDPISLRRYAWHPKNDRTSY